MPRRTQAQILRDETQLFLANSPSSQSTNERALRLQTRRNVRKLTRYLAGDTQEANLNLTTREQIQRFLDQMLPGLEQGRRFVLNNGSRYFTLTNDKFIDIQAWLTSLASFGDMSFYRADDALEEKSDEEARDGDFYSDLTVTSVPGIPRGASTGVADARQYIRRGSLEVYCLRVRVWSTRRQQRGQNRSGCLREVRAAVDGRPAC